MKAPALNRMWETFLYLSDGAEDGAENSGGEAINPALVILKRLREDVLPLVRRFEREGLVEWYSFLIHDRAGGVPVPEGDRGVYVHLRFSVTAGVSESAYVFPSQWAMTRPVPMPHFEAVDAVYPTWEWRLLGEQSALVLKVIEKNITLDDEGQSQCLGQFLHHFSNMTQMHL